VKFLALDWERTLGFLEALGRVTPATRQRLTRAELRALFESKALGEDVHKLLASGVLSSTLDPLRVRTSDAFHDTHKLLRALERIPLLAATDEQMLGRYVAEHFDEDERYSLGQTGHGYGGGMRGIVARLTSVAHTRTLLESRSPETWEQGLLERMTLLRRGRPPAGRLTAEAGGDLRLLLLHLIGGHGGLRLRELPRLFPELTRARLALAVELGLRHGVFFAALDAHGEVVLFLWPRVHLRLRHGEPPRPAFTTVSEGFVLPWALEDLQHLLARAGDGLRMKAGGYELFAAAERELAGGLVPLPDWLLEPGADARVRPEERVHAALRLALAAGHAEVSEEGRNRLLTLAEPGWAWLERAPRARLEALLRPLRESIATPSGRHSGRGPFQLSFRGEQYVSMGGAGAIARALVACFETLPAGQAVEVKAFLLHHALASNPLPALARARAPTFGEYSEEDLEQAFTLDLSHLLFRTLLPWGGVRAGLSPRRELTLELTSIGRYLLGLEPAFELEKSAQEERAPLRVQPDFEVVFVVPDPMLEARVARFAERRGKGVGVLFRITRDSILGAARTGLGAEEVLATLAEASPGPVPTNVTHEIRAWFARCRRFELEPVHLLRCPDAETAERVLALCTKHLERLGDTLLALRDPARKAELLRACAKHGLFLAAPRPRRGERKDEDAG